MGTLLRSAAKILGAGWSELEAFGVCRGLCGLADVVWRLESLWLVESVMCAGNPAMRAVFGDSGGDLTSRVCLSGGFDGRVSKDLAQRLLSGSFPRVCTRTQDCAVRAKATSHYDGRGS